MYIVAQSTTYMHSLICSCQWELDIVLDAQLGLWNRLGRHLPDLYNTPYRNLHVFRPLRRRPIKEGVHKELGLPYIRLQPRHVVCPMELRGRTEDLLEAICILEAPPATAKQ